MAGMDRGRTGVELFDGGEAVGHDGCGGFGDVSEERTEASRFNDSKRLRKED